MPAAPITRRRLLLGGLGLGLVGAAGGAAVPVSPVPPTIASRPRSAVPAVTKDSAPGNALVERVWSQARGMYVELVTMRPAGVSAGPLPVCLILHGRGGAARDYIPFGIPALLTGAVRAGAPPFAAVAVDCGRMYYMNHGGDDPMRMLVEEVPRWLAHRRHAAPTAVLGFSMGGWGALNLARRRPDLRAVALASPALFQRWSVAETRKAFASERQWREHEPLQHIDELGAAPIGLWCGSEDSFAGPAREFIRKAHPEHAAITKGAHDNAYWHKVLPEIMRFVGSHLA
ncbi:MAG TPA: alpha/beta hydrolase-fold protein [Actinophytocola sp.]|uniref:alpha/beta hydrolase n=1 Tax=Actinophytocola sp. TaxID=1872138 RepID=UPI002DBE69C2|nr:alpha/beta hydrolase-fold protein [Actinophytocola sp.]HEU5474497.1 alpha/beta hydrolase-fold protein [Actinophytocola sp.]